MVWDPDVKRLIIGALDVLSSLLAVLMLLAGTVIGGRAGAVEGAAIVGAVAGFLISFVVVMIMFGTLFLLLEINGNLRAIRTALTEAQRPE